MPQTPSLFIVTFLSASLLLAFGQSTISQAQEDDQVEEREPRSKMRARKAKRSGATKAKRPASAEARKAKRKEAIEARKAKRAAAAEAKKAKRAASAEARKAKRAASAEARKAKRGSRMGKRKSPPSEEADEADDYSDE